MNITEAILMISSEFNPSKQEWLALALQCLENADVVESYVSMETARKDMLNVLQDQIEDNVNE